MNNINDHDREMLDDVMGVGGSNCCGAATYELGDNYICTDCKEWCELEKEEEASDRAFSKDQLAIIAAIERACADAGCEDEHKCNE